MELRELRYFLAIVRSETICGAAEALHLTQPTLSRSMICLEEELGKRLFRRGRRVSLTEEGRLFHRRALEILELVDRARQDIASPDTNVSGTVSVGGGETRAMRYVARACVSTSRQCPLVDFRFHSGNGDETRELLERGVLDFAVFIEPFNFAGFDFIRLPVRDVWGVLVRSDHPLAGKKTVRPTDLRDVPLLTSRQSLVNNEIAGWMGAEMEHGTLRVAGTYNLLYNASLMVEEGLGAALCLEGIVRLREGDNLVFLPLDPPLEVGVCLAWKKNSDLSRAARHFLASLRQVMEKERASSENGPDTADGDAEARERTFARALAPDEESFPRRRKNRSRPKKTEAAPAASAASPAAPGVPGGSADPSASTEPGGTSDASADDAAEQS